MNFRKRNKSIVDILFLLALFCAFLISALFIVLFGARIYKKTVSDMQVNYTSRTALSYVTEKLRQHDSTGCISIQITDSQPVLVLTQDINGEEYSTYLFSYDGYLKEVTMKAGNGVDLNSGQKLIELKSFIAEQVNNSLYHFTITDSQDNTVDFYISLYSDANSEILESE